ncbi:Aldo/keto reductase [Thelephora ganbajun]|uniref:Aldo/keto reductase n=1 Tax=Thelephora ganbajun TaxID=370292 RepID=A0ACB6ZTR8_THEGA|nr:Aldo/keto reductase [Thelephora ganbajun]
MAFTPKSTARLPGGHQIPLLGLGVYQNYSARTSVLQALEAGYRHVDSARTYRNEEAVGQDVAQSNVKREDIFVTSKITGRNQGYQSALQSTKRLETYKALLEARDEGKIRNVGVSNYGIHHLKEITEVEFEPPAVNQIQGKPLVHPFRQQRETVDYCQKNGIIVQAYSPLIRVRKGMFDHLTITAIANKHGKDDAQKGYGPLVWATLPKSSDPKRIASNAAVSDFELDGGMADLDS